nr:hypothetical protein [Candidatus Cloacimonadota bacterium]
MLYIYDFPLSDITVSLIQVKSMCKALASIGHEVLLSIPCSDFENSLNETNVFFAYGNYQIHFRPSYKSKLHHWLDWKSVDKSVLQFRPDLIYLRRPLTLFKITKFKIPTIIELHSARLHPRSSIINEILKHNVIRIAKKSFLEKVVCVSQAIAKSWIAKDIPNEKVLVSHDAIDENAYRDHIDKSTARKKLGLAIDKVIVTYVGALFKNRKIERIVFLAKDFPNLHFLVVGGSDEQKDYYQKMSQKFDLTNICFVGRVDSLDVPNYLFASDILLALFSWEIPTINYCSPMKIFEYMASGRLIVAEGYPTIHEILIDNQNALIVEPESYDDLKMGIHRALHNNEKDRIVKNAMNDVFSKHTWRIRAKQILDSLSLE